MISVFLLTLLAWFVISQVYDLEKYINSIRYLLITLSYMIPNN